jgi:hypothetical protein
MNPATAAVITIPQNSHAEVVITQHYRVRPFQNTLRLTHLNGTTGELALGQHPTLAEAAEAAENYLRFTVFECISLVEGVHSE